MTTFFIDNYNNKFNNKINDKNSHLSKYIELLKSKDLNNIEKDIDKIETETINAINEFIILYNNKNMLSEFIKNNAYTILKKELEITQLLLKYCQSNRNIDNNILLLLSLLLVLSTELSRRIKQKKIYLNNINKLHRSSYKFCSLKDNCTYNYDLNEKRVCYRDHYVHNIVCVDICSIINYLNDNKTIIEKELITSIKTLNFVVSNMESELHNKIMYLPVEESDKYHYVKNDLRK